MENPLRKTHFAQPPRICDKVCILTLLLFFSQSSFALSLGAIKVTSTFAQPFEAKIELPSYTQEELKHLEINLASNALFAEQGLEVLPIFQKFRFSVSEHNNRKAYINIRSKESVNELSISFLLKVTWRGGNLIKNYDVLLTPDAITQIKKPVLQKIAATTKQPVSKKSSPKTKKLEKKHRAKPTYKLQETENGGVSYSVASGDNLHLIASRVRADRDMSINQVMVSLYEGNSIAFKNNNINHLKIGATLKIDDMKNVTRISRRKASQLTHQYMAQASNPKKDTKINPTENENIANNMNIPNNRLVISNNKEEPIPLDIMKRIKSEKLAADKATLDAHILTVKSLKAENKALKDRIFQLENQKIIDAEELFIATIDQNIEETPKTSSSLTQQEPNLIIASTEIDMATDETSSLMQQVKKYQTAISLSSVTLLSMTLIGMRKKEEIIDILHNVRARFKRG